MKLKIFLFLFIHLDCGGCGRNNWMPFNDAMGNSPGSEKTHNKLNPSQLLPFLGKPNSPSPLLKMNSGKMKSAEHGSKRFDVTYNTGDPSGMAWSPNSWYPCDPSYGNWPCQTPTQQSSISDQVVGTLFLWRPNGKASSSKHSTVRRKRRWFRIEYQWENYQWAIWKGKIYLYGGDMERKGT